MYFSLLSVLAFFLAQIYLEEMFKDPRDDLIMVVTVLKSSRQGWHRIRRRGIFRFDGERGYSGGPKRRIRRQTSIESQSWCCFIIEFQLFL